MEELVAEELLLLRHLLFRTVFKALLTRLLPTSDRGCKGVTHM
jgi:hypothetical protein